MEAIKIKAMYRNGVLEPEEPLVLSEGENVTVIIESCSDFSEEKTTSLSQIATRGPNLVEPPLSEIADEVHAYRKEKCGARGA